MSISRTVRRTTVATVVAAVGLSLVPALAAPATAATALPAFSYVVSDFTSPSTFGRVRATSPADSFGSAVELSSPNYAYGYDVSEDGNVAAYYVQTRSLDTFPDDVSRGLVVVKRVGTTVTATQIATYSDVSPVVSADGTTVYWITGPNLYKYELSSGETSLVTDAFGSAGGEFISRLAVLEDGTSAVKAVAAVWTTYDSSFVPVSSRLQAQWVTDGVNHKFTASGSITPSVSGTTTPSATTLVFKDENTLLYSRSTSFDGNRNQLTFDTRLATLNAAGNTSAAGPGAFYDVRKIDTTWYMWRDSGSNSEVGTTNDPATAPSAFITRPNGSTTSRYIPSTAVPPALPAQVSNLSAYTSFLTASGTTVLTSGRVYLLGSAQTGAVGPDPSGYGNPVNKRGLLQYSTTGAAPWTTLTTTTGSTFVGPVGKEIYNGRSQALTRNTWFRFVHPSDLLSAQSTSKVVKISVKPTITISKAKSGTKTKVYGKIARQGGTAVLYKKSSTGAYVRVTSTTISSTGAYSFGYRSLARGSYRVTSVGDAKWASNYKNFTI